MTQTAAAPAPRTRALLHPASHADSPWGESARRVRGKPFLPRHSDAQKVTR